VKELSIFYYYTKQIMGEIKNTDLPNYKRFKN
jgi:hypothetical protein